MQAVRAWQVWCRDECRRRLTLVCGAGNAWQDAAELDGGEPAPPALLLWRPPGGHQRAQAGHAVSRPRFCAFLHTS